VLLAIARCRTAALGGHLDECTRCAQRAPIYGRNRHCPKCQTAAPDRWITARRKELLPTRYHVVFTLLRHLAPLVLQNKKVLYDLPVSHQCGNPSGSRSLSQTSRRGNGLLQRAAPLESKTRNSPCVVPAGGWSPDHWVPASEWFFLPMSCCVLTLSLNEFLRRFLWHVLPKGFVRIRHFGFLANRKRATNLPLCFPLLGCRRCGVIA